MGIGILLVKEVRIVGADEFDVVFARQLDQHGVDAQLLLIGLLVAVGFVGLMTLEFEVIILAEHPLEPLHRLFCSGAVTVQDLLTHLAAQTRRASNDALVILLQYLLIYTRARIERIVHIARTNEFAQVVVAEFVLRQQDEVKTRLVYLIHLSVRPCVLLVGHRAACTPRTVRLHTDDRLERHKRLCCVVRFRPLRGVLLVDFLAIIDKLLDAVHIAVIGQGNRRHIAADTFIDYFRHFRHAVERRIVGVNV